MNLLPHPPPHSALPRHARLAPFSRLDLPVAEVVFTHHLSFVVGLAPSVATRAALAAFFPAALRPRAPPLGGSSSLACTAPAFTPLGAFAAQLDALASLLPPPAAPPTTPGAGATPYAATAAARLSWSPLSCGGGGIRLVIAPALSARAVPVPTSEPAPSSGDLSAQPPTPAPASGTAAAADAVRNEAAMALEAVPVPLGATLGALGERLVALYLHLLAARWVRDLEHGGEGEVGEAAGAEATLPKGESDRAGGYEGSSDTGMCCEEEDEHWGEVIDRLQEIRPCEECVTG